MLLSIIGTTLTSPSPLHLTPSNPHFSAYNLLLPKSLFLGFEAARSRSLERLLYATSMNSRCTKPKRPASVTRAINASLIEASLLWVGRLCVFYALLKAGLAGSEVNPLVSETQHYFNATDSYWGFSSFMPLTLLHNPRRGYMANDSLAIKAEVCVLTVTPPVNVQPARPTDSFDSYFTGLEELINVAETNGASVGSSLCRQDGALRAEIPSSKEVEKAKQSLKECLSHLFRLDMKERLSKTLSTLSSARTGLTSKQQLAIKTFLANFNDFTSNFLTFEQDNAEFELHKLQKDKRFSAMKKCHETHVLYKQLMDDIIKEEEEVKSRRKKLLSDWETLLVESEEVKSGYKDEQKKVAEAEEKKRIAEERMSRSTTAWSNLKAEFC